MSAATIGGHFDAEHYLLCVVGCTWQELGKKQADIHELSDKKDPALESRTAHAASVAYRRCGMRWQAAQA